MKKGFFYSMLVMISFALMSSTCSSDDDGMNGNNNSAEIQLITNTMQSGTWRITNFVDSGQDETSNFSGYNFSFNTDGTLVADNGTTTVNGTWSVTDDDSSSDDSSSDDDIDFNIAFISPSNFEELTEDWEILTRSSSKIDLRHISGGNGGTDLLTFEKN
ncbi:hypothetical protein [Aquimarina rubra]|uniref:META domain-containing protein n=1 Tax=Aquimarina rubra TaxID=1920033 RepID=A0ABW5LHI9_9FLAO